MFWNDRSNEVTQAVVVSGENRSQAVQVVVIRFQGCFWSGRMDGV